MARDRMPVLFVGHGNPMNAIQDTKWSRGFKRLADLVPRPHAVLSISAHWYVDGTYLEGNERPRTIHDFGGFPPELYEVQYPARGDPALADRVRGLLAPWRAAVREDWGIDHGTWSVLRRMYPDADVPVVQLSIDGHAKSDEHWAIGEALRPLRESGVLVLGSGNLVHNLRSTFQKMRARQEETESWGLDFDERVASALENADAQALRSALDDETGRLAHPTPDHFLPILYAAAAAGPGADVSFPVEGFEWGDVSMRSVLFT